MLAALPPRLNASAEDQRERDGERRDGVARRATGGPQLPREGRPDSLLDRARLRIAGDQLEKRRRAGRRAGRLRKTNGAPAPRRRARSRVDVPSETVEPASRQR